MGDNSFRAKWAFQLQPVAELATDSGSSGGGQGFETDFQETGGVPLLGNDRIPGTRQIVPVTDSAMRSYRAGRMSYCPE